MNVPILMNISLMMTQMLNNDLSYTLKKPLYYHVEVEDQRKQTIFRANNITDWQELEKFLEDWRVSQQSNDVNIWIATSDNTINTSKTPR